jgi:lipoyl(octanoyl) transferase
MLDIKDWGLISYADGEKKQLDLFNSKLESKAKNEPSTNYLNLLEHTPVFTLGKNGDTQNILPLAKMSGADIHNVSRGGDVTYHGPGQLVAYPIIDLQDYKMGVRAYVTALEEIGIELCSHYGIEAKASEEEGVWLDLGTPKARKIMAIGIKLSRYITMHGIAYNVNTDMKYFEYIVPCGIPNKGVTSLQKELGREVDMQEVKDLFVALFENKFKKGI